MRLAARRAKATPILSELRAFLNATMEKVSGKSSLSGAFRYAVSGWTALTRYVGDGRLERSNNAAERAIRPLATGLSLCTSFSSVWKHWKRPRRLGATRAPFPSDGRGDGLRMQVA